MPPTYEQIRLAMDGLEALCSNGAFLGACACLGEFESRVTAYADPTSEPLGDLLLRLRAAVERHDFAQVCSTSSDLRAVLASQSRARHTAHAAP